MRAVGGDGAAACMNVKIDDPVLAVCWVQCLGGSVTSGPRRSARQPAQTSWSRDGLGAEWAVTITTLSYIIRNTSHTFLFFQNFPLLSAQE